jgi:hypothetical protein
MKLDKNTLHSNIQSYLQDCYFDVAPSPSKSSFIFDEAHLAKLLTRIVVSAATVVTTGISLKQYIKEISSNYRKSKT